MAPATPQPHWMGHRDRLRRRLVDRGPKALDDHELLEVLLFAIIPRRDVKPIAKDLLKRFGSLSAILSADRKELLRIDGLGDHTATHFLALREALSRASFEPIRRRPLISSWSALLAYVRTELQHETREQLRVLFLDRKNQLIADEILGHGTVDHAPVHPREVARRAIELAASALILVHNHPSGDPSPSRSDIDMTRALIDALSAFEIAIHDHLIVGHHGIFSFKSDGLI
jgi:DNA repair protein RadC